MDKIKINLEVITLNRLYYDFQTFFPDPSATSFNGFVLSVINRMYLRLKARREDSYQKVMEVLGPNASQEKAEKIVDSLNALSSTHPHSRLDQAISLRPNKADVPLFREIEENELSEMSLSTFLRLLLEDFLSLNPAERETILFQREIGVCIDSIDKKHMLSITQGDSTFLFRPYGLFANPEQTFVYLYGYSGESGNIARSIHVFKLKDLVLPTRKSYSFSKKETDDLLDHLQNGVAFASEGQIKVEALLDQYGLKMLTRIYYGRPYYELGEKTKEEDSFTPVTFYGTFHQIKQYVFRLGFHAFVTEPSSLQGELLGEYRRCYKHYAKMQKKA